jgi:hypothetical protein
MATSKPRRRAAPTEPAADPVPEPTAAILATGLVPAGSGPYLLGRDPDTGALTVAADDDDALEWVVGGEVMHEGPDWLAPEHVRGLEVTARRPLAS